jgi:hypothetical protein
MKNNLHLIHKTTRLSCSWGPTGDIKRPLACVWSGSKTAQAAPAEPSKIKAGRMHLCA